MRKLALWLVAAILVQRAVEAQATPAVGIVAAENSCGVVAQQLAGRNTAVTSILSNPYQDPHLFETSLSADRNLSTAAVVVYNGADYDPWLAKLLAVAHEANRKVIVVADFVPKKAGDNHPTSGSTQ
jgi:zinc/manganese transport system substrate-binding protein